MRFRKTLTFITVTMALVFALPAWAQQKPFTQEQVVSMVRDGFGDESGAKLIEQRGIDFAPSEDFIQTLKAAGASEAFLNALRAAKPPEPASAKKPLNQVQVFALLVGQVPGHRVTMLVQERGIDFEPTDDYLQEVRLAGGEDELISALKSAKVTKRVTVDPAARARQTEVRQHAARGAELARKRQFAEAEREYRAALLFDPQNPDLCASLGMVLRHQKKWDDAAVWYRKAAEQGNAFAQCTLGDLYETGKGVPKDYALAALWYRKAAEQGYADAQESLGDLYETGDGVSEDYALAALWYRKAAEQGDADAQERLGNLYERGKGVPQDHKEAALWWRKATDSYGKAAEQGDAWAQSSLAELYESGLGVPQDYAQAALWFRKSAEQGNAEAQLQLGNLYLDGHGAPQDAVEAAAWYLKAAEQGNAAAQLSLAELYESGHGVLQDFAEAYFWLDLAAAGRLDAPGLVAEWYAKKRDEAASHLTITDLAREQERARKWFEAHRAKPQ